MTGIPNSWSELPLSELGMPGEQTVLTGPFGANLGREDFVASGVPIFTIGCLGTDNIDESKLRYVSARKAKELTTYRLREGDFLFSRMASVGRAGFVPAKLDGALFNYHLMRLRLNGEAILPRLFYYYVRGSEAVRQYLDGVSRGATRDGINTKLLLNMPVLLPPVAEQRRIVAKIESVAAKSGLARGRLDHIPRLVEKYKHGILRSAFRGDLTREWRLAHASANPSKNSADGPWEIPETWRWRTVAQIGSVTLGRQRSPKDHNGPRMRPYIRAANITWAGWNLDDVKEMNFTDDEFVRFKLKAGDLLVNEGSGSAKEVGKPAIWNDEIPNCCFQNTLLRVQPSECTTEFLYHYFRFCALTGRFVESTQGVNIFHIGKDGLSKCLLPLPPREEQNQISILLKNAFAWIDRLVSEIDNARRRVDHLDQAILAKAFRGELVPQDPNDEPASVLLERIRTERAGQVPTKRSKRVRK